MDDRQSHGIPPRTFILVWLVLLSLTALTVIVAGLHLGALSTLTALCIASVKAGLVLWFFMHLKKEKRSLKLLLLVPIVTLTIMMGLTFIDFWFR